MSNNKQESEYPPIVGIVFFGIIGIGLFLMILIVVWIINHVRIV